MKNNSLPLDLCAEYDAAARWCAERGFAGNVGDPLPAIMDTQGALQYINADPEAFQARVKEFAYARAMNQTHVGICEGSFIDYLEKHG